MGGINYKFSDEYTYLFMNMNLLRKIKLFFPTN